LILAEVSRARNWRAPTKGSTFALQEQPGSGALEHRSVASMVEVLVLDYAKKRKLTPGAK